MVKEALERLIDILDEVIASKERRFIAFINLDLVKMFQQI